MLPKFMYSNPEDLAGALAVLEDRPAVVHAGGTDLVGCLRDGVMASESVLSLSSIAGLKGIQSSASGMRIGAMTTIAEIATDATVAERYRALADAARVVASPQLRNQGTIGGNLCQKPRCWYYRGDFHCLRKGGGTCYAYQGENQYHCIFGGDMCYIVHPSDTAPALAALGAACRLASPGGGRSVAVESMFVLPTEDPQRETVLEVDEILTDIRLPAPAPGLRSSYRKVRTRAAWDFAVAGVALAIAFDGGTVRSARVFLSAAAPIPWRARGVEDVITGSTLDDEAIAAAAAAAVEGAEPLANNAFKIDLFKGLVTEQLEAIRST